MLLRIIFFYALAFIYCITISAQETVFPYMENFESGTGNWSFSSTDLQWLRHSSSTPTVNTGPNAAYDGSYFLYIEPDLPGVAGSNIAYIENSFDFSSLSGTKLIYKYHRYGEDMGFLSIKVHDGSSWATLKTITGEQQTSSSDDWISDTLDLSAYDGNSNVIIRFSASLLPDFMGYTYSDMAIDKIEVFGDSNDDDSYVNQPASQIPGGDISSLIDDSGMAVDVFSFTINDTGANDTNGTKVKRVIIKNAAPANSANWLEAIQSIILRDNTQNIPVSNIEINSNEIVIDFAINALTVSNGQSKEITMSLFLNSSNIEDNSTLQFKIPQTGHNWQAFDESSSFSNSFSADVISSLFTIRVEAQNILFRDNFPPDNITVNINFGVEVFAVDENGNIDTDENTGNVNLSVSTGTGLLSSVAGLDKQFVNGIASWSDIQYDTEELFKIYAEVTTGNLLNQNIESHEINSSFSLIAEIGNAISSDYYYGPIYRSSSSSSWDYSRHSSLYPHGRLENAGLPPGAKIIGLSWYKTNTNSISNNGNAYFDIYLKNSNLNNKTTLTPWSNIIQNIENRKSDTINTINNLPNYEGWVYFDLDSIFVYNDNGIEVSTEWDISNVVDNPTTGEFNWRYTDGLSNNYSIGIAADNYNGTSVLQESIYGGTLTPDIRIHYIQPDNMSYDSCIVEQITGTVLPSETNKEVVCVKVYTSGWGNPISLTEFNLNAVGTDNPSINIENARIYYTASVDSFTTDNLYGSYATPEFSDYIISGNQELTNGVNYFWLTYDIKAGAIYNDKVDAVCNSIHCTDIGTVAPGTPAPSGYRKIVNNIIYTCSYDGFKDPGGNSMYSAGCDSVSTFCSDNGQSVEITFFEFELGAGDTLFVYDDIGISGNLLYVLVDEYDYPPRITSPSSCITLHFVSDNTTNDNGWDGDVRCTDFCDNPIASNTCNNNTPNICNLNGYCGNTSGLYTANTPGNITSEFEGTIHNNSWMTFQAAASSISFDIEVYNCTDTQYGEGMQMGVYSGTDCDNFSFVNGGNYTGAVASGNILPPNTTTTVNLSGLTIGQTYYIMVDGMWGCVCNYRINSATGFLVPNAGQDQTVCTGTDVMLNASGATNPAGYSWEPASELSNPNIANPTVNNVVDDMTFVVDVGSADCPAKDTMQIYVIDRPVSNPGNYFDVCGDAFQFNATNNYTNEWSYTGSGNATFTPGIYTGNAEVAVDNFGAYQFTWATDNGYCQHDSTFVINFHKPIEFNLTTAGESCSNEYQFEGTVIADSGYWYMQSGSGQVFYYPDSTDVNATAITTEPGTKTFYYKAFNGVCIDSTSVTVQFYETPVANAGTDNRFCDTLGSLSATITIGNGTWSQVSGSGTSIFTPSVNDAAADIEVSQVGVYEYEWLNDNNGCIDRDTVEISFFETPVADAGIGGNECDLDIDLAANPSVGIGTWSLVNGSGNIVNVTPDINTPDVTIEVSAVGSYTFQWLEDNSGCKDSATVVASFSGQANADAGAGGDECDLDFVLNATPSVGTGTWSQVSGTGISSFTDVNAPDATVTVSDYGTYEFKWYENNNGCEDSSTVTVNFYEQPVANAGTDAEFCDTSGVLNAVSSVGIGTWTQIGANMTTYVPDANTAACNIEVTQENTYSYIWTDDNNGCTDSDTVEITFHALPIADAGADAEMCEGDSVLIDASNSSGFPTMTYEWIGLGNDVQYYVGPAASRDYVLSVTDGHSCTMTDTMHLIVNEQPVADTTGHGDVTFCGGDDGWISVTNSSQYEYEWNTTPVQDSAVATGLTEGNYTVTISLGDCFITQSQTITAPDDIVVTQFNNTPADSICEGTDIVITANGISSGQYYVYVDDVVYDSIPYPDNTLVISGLTNGQEIHVYGNQGNCTGYSDTTVMTVLPMPNPEINGDYMACVNETGANFSITDEIGHLYEWTVTEGTINGVDNENQVTVDWQGPGTGLLTITDSIDNGFGCIASDELDVIISQDVPELIVTDPEPVCEPNTIDITTPETTTGSQEVVELHYWEDAGTSTSLNAPDNLTQSGTYYIEAVNGCGNDIEPVHVFISNEAPVIATLDSMFACLPGTVDLNNAIISSTEEIADTSFWNNANFTGPVLSPDAVDESGVYYILAENGCGNDNGQVRVFINDAPPGLTITDPTPVCFGGSIDITDESLYESIQVINRHYWNDQNGSNPIQNPENITVGGTYYVSALNSCDTLVFPINVNINSTEITSSWQVIPPSCDIGEDGQIAVAATGGAGMYNFSWEAYSSTDSLLTDIKAGTYIVNITDQYGCLGQDTIDLIAPENTCLEIPDAFTPNGDGVNDYFEIGDIHLYPGAKLSIFNRWGDVIFSEDNYNDEDNWWDGTFNGQDVATGSYIFVLEFSQGYQSIQGVITVVR